MNNNKTKQDLARFESEDTDVSRPLYFKWFHKDSIGFANCFYCNGGSARAGCPNAYSLPVYPKDNK